MFIVPWVPPTGYLKKFASNTILHPTPILFVAFVVLFVFIKSFICALVILNLLSHFFPDQSSLPCSPHIVSFHNLLLQDQFGLSKCYWMCGLFLESGHLTRGYPERKLTLLPAAQSQSPDIAFTHTFKSENKDSVLIFSFLTLRGLPALFFNAAGFTSQAFPALVILAEYFCQLASAHLSCMTAARS